MIRSTQKLLWILAPAMLLCFSATAVVAEANSSASPSGTIPHGTVTLVSDVPVIQPDSNFQVAFHFTLETGWHIYWSNPGDSGEPPRLIWHLPAGVKPGAIEWPAPKMLALPGVMDFGYTGDVSLLVPMHASALGSAKTADLGVQLKVIVCRELCIPGGAQLSLPLPVSAAKGHVSQQTANLFAAARSRLPEPAPHTWKIRGEQNKDQFVLEVTTGKPVSQAVFFPLDEELIENTSPQIVESTANGFRIALKKDENLSHPVTRLRGVIEIPEGAYIVAAAVPPLPATKAPSAKAPARALPRETTTS